ncbi:MAG: DUF4405 domain-containing protein [Verrucomicrobiales bacterium]|nr:DUF4405 domain-containing protein [Verrucomicrobiales bacterium]
MERKRAAFQWRAMISVLVAFAFALMIVTGVVLYIAPPGRVANWTDWSILALRKGEWAAMHISFGAVFLVAGIIHLIFNWRPLVGYFKRRLTRQIGLRAEWAVAVGLGVVILAGTKADLPPFGTLAALGEELKERWDRPAERAPIPHAELLTVAQLAEQAKVDVEAAAARLRAGGIQDFTPDTVVRDLAAQSGLAAQRIYEIMVPPVTKPPGQGPAAGRGAGGAGGAGRGLGWKTLGQFCVDEGIELTQVTQRLEARGIAFTPEQTLREIAQANGFDHPFDLLAIARGE